MGNASVKLIFPSHGIPFTIPEDCVSKISTKINELLKDITAKSSTNRGRANKITLPVAGITLDFPQPNDWVLIEVENPTVIHMSLAAKSVVLRRTYLVLPMSASGISVAALKEAIGVIQSGGDKPPGYHD